MKKLLFLLLPFFALAQNPTSFPYGIKNPAAPDRLTPAYLTTTDITTGLQGKIPSTYIAKTDKTAQADTGVLTFGGLSANSATTINIGAVVGLVVDNETNPLATTSTMVNYPGVTGLTVTTVGSGQASYVMLSSAGVISFQTTFPTSAERKAKIWLGKVSHPAGSITLVINEPDYITSPMAFSRDILQALGGFINNGVYPIENGANLNMNITGGEILGDGANFVTSRTNPNFLSMGPNTAATFSERTQTGGVTAGVTSVSVGFYDVAGTVTAIPGPGATSSLRYIFAIPGQGYVMQYGQVTYASLSAAIAAIGKETFVKWSNLNNNAILIGVLAARKDATSLRTADGQAQFFQADRLGGLIGSTAGVSTATMQSAYNNSSVPQVVVTDALGAMTWQSGRALNSSTITSWRDNAGAEKATMNGNGELLSVGQIASSVSTGDAILGESVSGRGVYATSQSTTLPALFASNTTTGPIAEFRNGSGLKASIDNAGNITANSISTPNNKITITTSISITTATTDTNGLTQNGKHVVIDNGVNAINITCNGGVTTSYGKAGTGAITFVQGSGRTLVTLNGTAILNGIAGSTATLWSNGTTDYLAIVNY